MAMTQRAVRGTLIALGVILALFIAWVVFGSMFYILVGGFRLPGLALFCVIAGGCVYLLGNWMERRRSRNA